MLLCPKEVSFSELQIKKSLSPRNFSSIGIENSKKVILKSFLMDDSPFDLGDEPGSFSYVPKSDVSFVRNSCIDSSNFSNQPAKEICLNPKYGYNSNLKHEDVLLCKDANIGDSCLFIPSDEKEYVISSGVVRLNFKDEAIKYYCLAFLRDEYFLKQLDALTPKGSTIRHAGSKFLDCMLPTITNNIEGLLPLFESLIKNIAYAERISYSKLCEANALIEKEFLVTDYDYDYPNASYVMSSTRLDAGYYSKTVSDINYSLENYKNGYESLKASGFSMKRGPNLQKRDLGRSIKSPDYRKNYHLLVYPSDISDNGYVLKEVYIGARNPVWYMRAGDILFSAEGTVGKVFVICDEEMKFITNIHGLIISPKSGVSLNESIMLGQYLHFLRSYGYFDKVSVGGQGGSFAVNYWDDFKVPKFDPKLRNRVAKLYHSGAVLNPEGFSIKELNRAGVFELNQFRIKCNELVKLIVRDIKNDNPQDKDYYLSSIV